MQNLAQVWLVYRLTHSTLLVGTLGFCSQIPVLVLGPLGGLAADRFPRRTLVMVAQLTFLAQSLLLAALTLTDTVTVGWLLGLALSWGAINALDIPARQALVVHMVGKEDLQNAIALNSMTFNAARVVGPSIGGFLVATVGEGLCFALNAVSYLAVLASLWLIRPDERATRGDESPLRGLREGFRYVWNAPAVRAMLLVTALANFALAPVQTLAPVFADGIFGRGSQGLGLLTGSLGLGAVAGTFVLARQAREAKLAQVVAWSTVWIVVAQCVFAASPLFVVSMAASAGLGYCIFRQLSATNTLIQSSIDDRFRGRVMSLYSMTVVGITPLGNLAAGAVAEVAGVRVTVALGAVVGAGAALLWRRQITGRIEE